MSLRSKIVSILFIFFVFIGLLIFIIHQSVILPSFVAIEQSEAVKNAKRVHQAIIREIHHLDSLVHDWSAWDVTYEFSSTRSQEYIEENLPISSFIDNRLNLIFICNSTGEILFGEIRDLETEAQMIVDGIPTDKFPDAHPLINFPPDGTPLSEISVSGIYMSANGPLITASRPILTSNNQGPVRGAIVMGRFLNHDLVRILQEQTQVDFQIISGEAAAGLFPSSGPLQDSGLRIDTATSDKELVVYDPFRDIEGRIAFFIQSRIPKNTSARGRIATQSAIAAILLAGFGAILITLFFLNWTVFGPAKQLIVRARQIGKLEDVSHNGIAEQKEEIGILADTLDAMVRRLQDRSDALKHANAELKKDMIRLREAEAEKIKNQKIAAEHKKLTLISRIAGKMAHDFNNVLGVIMGNTEILMLESGDASVRERLGHILDQTIRGKHLTKNLVAFAKDQEPRPRFLDLNKQITDVVNLMKNDLAGIDVSMDLGEGLPELMADPGMIEHTLANLLQNAIHAVSMVTSPKIIIRSFTDDTRLCFEIEDTGCGIPAEHMEEIYEPAFTLKGSRDLTDSYAPDIKGTGYGLANVQKYIRQHNGEIHVKSASGAGTTVTVRLPIVENKLTAKGLTRMTGPGMVSQKKILLVEDEARISDIQLRILTRPPCCHTVDLAVNAREAITVFDTKKYDLVSLDYILAGKRTGMDIYHHIRKRDKTVPVLFTSGNIEFLESTKALKQEDARVDHLSKPCQNRDYINRINLLIETSNRLDTETV